jgi:hypothetical protein
MRKAMTYEQSVKFHDDLIKKNKLIEAGFVGLAYLAFKDATEEQYESLRLAFFAGSQHLFASIMAVLDTEETVTPEDLSRIDNIHKELETFLEQFKLKYLTEPQGNA